MVQLSCSFATNCRTKSYFSCADQGQQQLIPINSWVYSIKNVRETSTYPTVSFWLIWRLRRPRFHDIPQISCSTWCKVEREVNLKMAEGIKVGGESSWCQGDCKPNRIAYCNCYLRVGNKYGRRGRRALILTSVFLTDDSWLRWILYHMIARDTQILKRRSQK